MDQFRIILGSSVLHRTIVVSVATMYFLEGREGMGPKRLEVMVTESYKCVCPSWLYSTNATLDVGLSSFFRETV